MEWKLAFGIFSSALALFACIPYIRDILRRKTEPHAYTWLIWTILQGVGATIQIKGGGGYGAWALTLGTFICFSIFLLSLKYGTKNINFFDLLCLIASFGTLILYLFLTNPLYAVLAITIIDFIGFLPTFRKTFEEPFTETTSMYGASAVVNISSLLALQNYSLPNTLYMSSLFVTNIIMVTIILVRRKKLKN